MLLPLPLLPRHPPQGPPLVDSQQLLNLLTEENPSSHWMRSLRNPQIQIEDDVLLLLLLSVDMETMPT
jgi:hypothetical protein